MIKVLLAVALALLLVGPLGAAPPAPGEPQTDCQKFGSVGAITGVFQSVDANEKKVIASFYTDYPDLTHAQRRAFARMVRQVFKEKLEFRAAGELAFKMCMAVEGYFPAERTS